MHRFDYFSFFIIHFKLNFNVTLYNAYNLLIFDVLLPFNID